MTKEDQAKKAILPSSIMGTSDLHKSIERASISVRSAAVRRYLKELESDGQIKINAKVNSRNHWKRVIEDQGKTHKDEPAPMFARASNRIRLVLKTGYAAQVLEHRKGKPDIEWVVYNIAQLDNLGSRWKEMVYTGYKLVTEVSVNQTDETTAPVDELARNFAQRFKDIPMEHATVEAAKVVSGKADLDTIIHDLEVAYNGTGALLPDPHSAAQGLTELENDFITSMSEGSSMALDHIEGYLKKVQLDQVSGVVSSLVQKGLITTGTHKDIILGRETSFQVIDQTELGKAVHKILWSETKKNVRRLGRKNPGAARKPKAQPKPKPKKANKPASAPSKRYTRARALADMINSGAVFSKDDLIKMSNTYYAQNGGKDNMKEARWFANYSFNLLEGLGILEWTEDGKAFFNHLAKS